MNKATVVLIGAFGLFACAHNKPGTTTTTSAETKHVTAEDVQSAILETRPGEADEIYALIITNEDGIITLKGKVEDESTHAEVVARARAMRNVRGVVDKVRVVPKPGPSKYDTSAVELRNKPSGSSLTR